MLWRQEELLTGYIQEKGESLVGQKRIKVEEGNNIRGERPRKVGL